MAFYLLSSWGATSMMTVGAQVSLSRFLSTIANSTSDFPLAVLLGLDGDFVRLHALLSVDRC
jgi:hypothetical protein